MYDGMQVAQLRVPRHLVNSVKQKSAGDFFQVLSTCEVYEIDRLSSATW